MKNVQITDDAQIARTVLASVGANDVAIERLRRSADLRVEWREESQIEWQSPVDADGWQFAHLSNS